MPWHVCRGKGRTRQHADYQRGGRIVQRWYGLQQTAKDGCSTGCSSQHFARAQRTPTYCCVYYVHDLVLFSQSSSYVADAAKVCRSDYWKPATVIASVCQPVNDSVRQFITARWSRPAARFDSHRLSWPGFLLPLLLFFFRRLSVHENSASVYSSCFCACA